MSGVLIYSGPGEARNIAQSTGAFLAEPGKFGEFRAALVEGKTVVTGSRSLVTGWNAPPGTVIVFTGGFIDAYGSSSAEFCQARARVRPSDGA